MIKRAIFFGFVFTAVIAMADAETPDEVAKRIISSQSSPGYNPVDQTDAELDKAAAINSQLQLRALMLGDTVSEKLRVCYALRLIQERLWLKSPNALNPIERSLIHDQQLLAAHLRKLTDSRK